MGNVVQSYTFRPPEPLVPLSQMTDIIWLPNESGLNFPALYIRPTRPPERDSQRSAPKTFQIRTLDKEQREKLWQPRSRADSAGDTSKSTPDSDKSPRFDDVLLTTSDPNSPQPVNKNNFNPPAISVMMPGETPQNTPASPSFLQASTTAFSSRLSDKLAPPVPLSRPQPTDTPQNTPANPSFMNVPHPSPAFSSELVEKLNTVPEPQSEPHTPQNTPADSFQAPPQPSTRSFSSQLRDRLATVPEAEPPSPITPMNTPLDAHFLGSPPPSARSIMQELIMSSSGVGLSSPSSPQVPPPTPVSTPLDPSFIQHARPIRTTAVLNRLAEGSPMSAAPVTPLNTPLDPSFIPPSPKSLAAQVAAAERFQTSSDASSPSSASPIESPRGVSSSPGSLFSSTILLQTAYSNPSSPLRQRRRRKTIIFSHGNGEDLSRVDTFINHISDDLGLDILAYEYMGYGWTIEANPLPKGAPPLAPSEAMCYANIFAAYDFLVDIIGVLPEDIILYGRSLGTGPSIELATKRPVGGLILQSPILSVVKVAQNRVSIPFDMFLNVDKMPHVKAPTLIIHGSKDELVPAKDGQKLFELCGAEKKRFWLAEEAGHEDINDMYYTEWLKEVRNFFNL